jgi:AraC family transcriptional regulator, regulatory protein of adaptative response / methylated-DNA-[protein]-cysteine methyltransferase
MSDYERIADVIRHLDDSHVEQPDLAELANHVGLSPHHFHRLFSRWAGVTPKNFLKCLTLSHARASLRRGESVLDAALDAGLSGPGRLHDLCVNLEAASPGEVKNGGREWIVKAGYSETPFGKCLVAQSPRGICHLSFTESADQDSGKTVIQNDWPNATLEWDDGVANSVVNQMFVRNRSLIDRDAENAEKASTLCSLRSAEPTQGSLRAIVKGTQFQIRVWKALLEIPQGAVTSYSRLAESIGKPRAARAVGSAVGRNSLAYLIPCHRVIRETGVMGDYRWDPIRKRALLAWESAIH